MELGAGGHPHHKPEAHHHGFVHQDPHISTINFGADKVVEQETLGEAISKHLPFTKAHKEYLAEKQQVSMGAAAGGDAAVSAPAGPAGHEASAAAASSRVAQHHKPVVTRHGFAYNDPHVSSLNFGAEPVVEQETLREAIAKHLPGSPSHKEYVAQMEAIKRSHHGGGSGSGAAGGDGAAGGGGAGSVGGRQHHPVVAPFSGVHPDPHVRTADFGQDIVRRT